MSTLLSIKNLSIRFGSGETAFQAVKELNLTIRREEFLALVGESGSGKSVTALSILQLLPKSAGPQISGELFFINEHCEEIHLLQLSAKKMNEIRGKRIGMVFQEPMTALNPLLSCGKQIAEVLQKHKGLSRKKAKEETIQWMKRVQLPEPECLYDRYPHELSGGQKQRILIASAICCEPDLLICDEPTTALDVTVQKEILELIRNEQKQTGMAVLFISHDLALVSQYADRVAVLYKGEQVELGENPRIFQQPTHPYTRALIACRPAAHKKGERLPQINDFLSPLSDHRTEPRPKPIQSKSDETLLEAEKLSIGYPLKKGSIFGRRTYKTVVDAVNFEIKKGEMLGLVGESGSGKSTLGRAMLGLLKPSAGSIRYRGLDLTNLPPENWPLKRHQLQLIFQDPYSSLNPRMTIGDAIGEPIRVHRKVQNKKEERERVLQWLERVQLKPDHIDRYPHEFSGGQRQRIVIARALALEPEFVVCDESVSALDVSIQAQVLNLLNDLREALGFTCLFISHDLAVVRYLCDRLIVLKQGKIVEMGEAAAVCSNPKEPYTQNLLQSIPRLQSVE
jgi:peptide/nickel transport system ATP-binding protein